MIQMNSIKSKYYISHEAIQNFFGYSSMVMWIILAVIGVPFIGFNVWRSLVSS